MESLTIHLEPTKRRQRLQVINDAIPGAILLFVGFNAFLSQGGASGPLVYLDILVGALTVRYAIKELRGKESRSRVNWFDVFSGLVIIAEALNQYKPYKHFQPAHVLMLAGVITIARGIYEEKFPKLRKALVDNENFYVRSSLFRSLKIAWSEVERIEYNESRLVFIKKGGHSSLGLRRIGNKEHIIDAVRKRAQELGLDVTRTD